MNIHASAAARNGGAVLLLGPPGVGKSDLLLRLLDRGWSLVGDDRLVLFTAPGGRLRAAPAPELQGMMEVRGLGLVTGLSWAPAPVRLAVELAPAATLARLPAPAEWTALGVAVPLVGLDPAAPSAPARLEMALAVLAGRRGMKAGAFAA
ncbi:HPr kinase/phosphorylase [Roseococcus sp. DSY-14]|uniref:HPr kinase/phosphorylase n=1 Tax=Roseococcus sp. DSY-14 TaxID=3369650 RepID=UPI00387A89D7